jgi:hypothetical protein
MIDDAARLTIAKVKQYGVTGLYDGKKTDMQIATEAAQAITEQDKRLFDVETLMITDPKNDAMWERVRYEFRNHANMSCGHLVRIIEYKDFGLGKREDLVTYGPLVPTAKAEALLAVLNG